MLARPTRQRPVSWLGRALAGLLASSVFVLPLTSAPAGDVERFFDDSLSVDAATHSDTPTSETTILAGLKEAVTPRMLAGDRISACPADMIEVVGDYCPSVEQRCLRWLDPDTKLRCAEFAESKCTSKTIRKHFCIDKYEYPNKAGVLPEVMKTWYDAQNACKAQGKRLCGSSEWTLACEGQEHLPYPYGYERNADACNIDKPHLAVNEGALSNPATRAAEAARLDQRVPSGSMESCVSPYGVHDMAGNVDEWVLNESRTPYQSGSKGGYWGPVRTRCRPMTVAHYELFSFYQLGFRCCANPGSYVEEESSGGSGAGTDSTTLQNLELSGT